MNDQQHAVALAPKGPNISARGRAKRRPGYGESNEPSPERAKQRREVRRKMGQSLVKNLIHLVYSTKHRKLWLPEDVRDGLFAYQTGIFKQWGSSALVIGGVDDHVHALFSLSKNLPSRRLWRR